MSKYTTQPAVRLINKIRDVSEEQVRQVLGKGPRTVIGARDVRAALIAMGRVDDALGGLRMAPPAVRRHYSSRRRQNRR